jgi:hypothetical protein
MRLPSILAILLILLFLMVAAGCSTPVPVVPPWPNTPDDLKVTCPDLKTVDESTTKLSDVISTVTANYQQYYDCKGKVDDWIEWYNTQKSLQSKIK